MKNDEYVLRKPVKERILFIENKINNINNNGIAIKDYVNMI